jgi:hypothetical protein
MSDTIEYNFQVQVLILRENESWIAQGLDFDITGHGKTLDEVMENFERTFTGQILLDLHHGQKPLANIRKAPRFYWQKFDEAKRLAEKKQFSLPTNNVPWFNVSAETAIYA